MDLNQLKVSIENAFVDVAYPGDENITCCSYTETSDHPCDECVEIANYFRGKSWQGHNVQDLRCHEGALNLFSEEALHYFLPAFVLAVLEDPAEADVIYDSLIFLFTPSLTNRAWETAKRLSQAQRRVMVEYFQRCWNENGEYLDGNISAAIDLLCR